MTPDASPTPQRRNSLVPGLYEQLETQALREHVAEATHLTASRARVQDGDVARALSVHLGGLVDHALHAQRSTESRIALAQRVIAALGEDYAPDAVSTDPPLEMLRELRPTHALGTTPLPRPQTPLSDVALLTNAHHEPSLGAEIREELASADRVDLLCAFVKWHGLRTLEKELLALKDRGVPFRVITTTYVGATERHALDRMVREFGGEVRVNYATNSTRLHAKAWFFHRESGWSTAYVGSSNLSKSAMLDGLEWNVRLSAIATPALMRKFEATFNTYWADHAFEPYDPDSDAERLDQELRRGSFGGAGGITDLSGLDVHPYPHQTLMLEELSAERSRGHHQNLLVAATGTGKTVIAALDYRHQKAEHGTHPTLLFVAHRKEILEQARRTYRNVLADGTFGELFVDGQKPQAWKHVFASVQSLTSFGVENIPADHFDMVVVDEFHHAAAVTYASLLGHFQPREMLGLTATPERTDGTHVKDLFGGRIASELRLWDALDADILIPFHYFGIADDTDLSRVAWRNGQYDIAGLDAVFTGNEARARLVLKALRDKVGDLSGMKALGFCASVDHARFMAAYCQRANINAAVVVGETGSTERAEAFEGLRNGSISILFGVDVFNEGVDIPDVNTALFLRPTQSATIFLQQLGRGLRRAHGKSVLTALDFVGHQRAEFRFDLKLRALTGSGRKRLVEDVQQDFPYLPAGSQIVLDAVAKENILANIRQQIGVGAKSLAQDIRQHAGSESVWEFALTRYLDEADRTVADLYRPGAAGRSWTTLRAVADAGRPWGELTVEDRVQTMRAVRLRHVDDPDRAAAYVRILRSTAPLSEMNAADQQYARMLYFTVIHQKQSRVFESFDAGLQWARGLPYFVDEVSQLLEYLVRTARNRPTRLDLGRPTVLRSHAHYKREEILSALDIATWEKKQDSHREGVMYSPAYDADALLVTLNKDSGTFSPSTMYKDYALSRSVFHWESQNATSAASKVGRRYLEKAAGDSRTLLFVRASSTDDVGTGAAFLNLGSVDFGEWNGSERPMQITWELHRPMPEQTFLEASAAS